MRKHLSEMGIHMVEEFLLVDVLFQDQGLPAYVQWRVQVGPKLQLEW